MTFLRKKKNPIKLVQGMENFENFFSKLIFAVLCTVLGVFRSLHII
jgi:hypothetical protein